MCSGPVPWWRTDRNTIAQETTLPLVRRGVVSRLHPRNPVLSPVMDTATLWDLEVQRITARSLTRDAGPDAGDLFPAPVYPDKQWFMAQPLPLLDGGARPAVTVDRETGRVYGYFFEWGQCILGSGIDRECWTPPPSPSGYNLFHQGSVEVMNDDGGVEIIAAGLLVPGHSPPDYSAEASIEHYNNPERGVVVCRAYEDEYGGYIVGAVVPGRTYADVAMVQHSALSGHWEFLSMDGQTAAWDCLGPSLVVRPGLPLKGRARLASAVAPRVNDDGEISAYIGVIGDEMDSRTALAGTSMTYNELREAVEVEAKQVFNHSDDGPWVWVADFDDSWVVVSINSEDTESVEMRAPLTISEEGVTVNAGEAVEVEVEYVPVSAAVRAQIDDGETETTTETQPDEEPMDAKLLSRLNSMAVEVETLTTQVGALVDRVAALESTDAAKVIDELEVSDLPEPE